MKRRKIEGNTYEERNNKMKEAKVEMEIDMKMEINKKKKKKRKAARMQQRASTRRKHILGKGPSCIDPSSA